MRAVIAARAPPRLHDRPRGNPIAALAIRQRDEVHRDLTPQAGIVIAAVILAFRPLIAMESLASLIYDAQSGDGRCPNERTEKLKFLRVRDCRVPYCSLSISSLALSIKARRYSQRSHLPWRHWDFPQHSQIAISRGTSLAIRCISQFPIFPTMPSDITPSTGSK
jgi:hypothetical protein